MTCSAFMTESEVREATRKSHTTIWRWVRNGIFPAPVQLGPNSVGWRRSDRRHFDLRFDDKTAESMLPPVIVSFTGAPEPRQPQGGW